MKKEKIQHTNEPTIRRPKSAYEVCKYADTLKDFGYNLKDWIHELALISTRSQLAQAVAQKPIRLKDKFEQGDVADAYIAAYVDHLCQIAKIPSPQWTQSEDLILEDPWFSLDGTQLRIYLCRDTPPAFKNKNVFTEPEITLNIRPGRPRVSSTHKREMNRLRQRRFRRKQKLRQIAGFF